MKSKIRAFASLLLFSFLGVAIAQSFDLPLSTSEFATGFDLPLTDRSSAPDGLLVSVFDKPSPESRRDLLTIQQAAIEVSKRVSSCTVGLIIEGRQGIEMGSGVVISEDGIVLTAAHVVSEPGKDVQVLFPDGSKFRGVSLGMHTLADGAMVKITEDGKWPFVPLAPKDQGPKAGDWCLAIGHPGGFDRGRTPPVRLGRVIDVRSTVMRSDCPIMGGDSGGPLVDLKGRVIGIHSRIASDPTENYHVPCSAYHEAWDRMLAGKIYPKPTPSKFLSLLDRDDDGMLTREELPSGYHKRVFDRLVEEFELDDSGEYSIKSIAVQKFKWRNNVRASIVEIEDVRDFGSSILTSRDFVRGSMMEALVSKAVQQADLGGNATNGASQLAVRVYSDGRRVAMGSIMSKDGFVLTKASRLESGSLECRMPDGTRRSAHVVAQDEEYDLALLRVHADELVEPVWDLTGLKAGQMVVVPQSGGDLESIGVVSVLPRRIRVSPAIMGVAIDISVVSEALIKEVAPRSGAERAGMLAGDSIIRVDGESVSSRRQILSILEDFRAGDQISVVVRRNGKEIPLTVGLLSVSDVRFNMAGADSLDKIMKGRLSRRRDGFGSAFQIDAIVEPQFCGGPVVDLNGELIGITLARASRVATYVIGCKALQPVYERLVSQAESFATTRRDTIDKKTSNK